MGQTDDDKAKMGTSPIREVKCSFTMNLCHSHQHKGILMHHVTGISNQALQKNKLR